MVQINDQDNFKKPVLNPQKLKFSSNIKYEFPLYSSILFG